MFCMECWSESSIEEASISTQSNMRQGLVTLYPPVGDWLFDDGAELMPADREEWSVLHNGFGRLLDRLNTSYEVLPPDLLSLDQVSDSCSTWLYSNSLRF